jgi:hypothetical protein
VTKGNVWQGRKHMFADCQKSWPNNTSENSRQEKLIKIGSRELPIFPSLPTIFSKRSAKKWNLTLMDLLLNLESFPEMPDSRFFVECPTMMHSSSSATVPGSTDP